MVESFPLLFSVLFSVFAWLASLSAGDWWSYGAAFVVFVGVVGETIAELTNLVKAKSWARKSEVASALALILGLAGDIVSIHLTRIEEANLTREAGDAKQSALDAKTAAIQARQEADGAKSTADRADIIAKSADGLSSRASSTAGKAESLASDARQEADSASSRLRKNAQF